jgi:hypothetical protein
MGVERNYVLRVINDFYRLNAHIIFLTQGETMKNIISRGIMIVVLIMLSIGIVFSQGLSWESTTKIPMAAEKEVHSTSCYRPHMFKQSSDNNATIFRLDKELVYLIDNKKKEYSEMTFTEMEALTKKMSSELDGKMAEMKKQMENMPPEQRKMMEKMMGSTAMGGNPNAKTVVIKTAESKTISGYPCVKYALKEDGKEVGSVWTTTKVPDYGSMQKDMKEFGRRMAALMPRGAAQMVAAMEKVVGFTIQTTIAGITSTVTKIEKKTIATSQFEVPSGYKKVTPKELTGE